MIIFFYIHKKIHSNQKIYYISSKNGSGINGLFDIIYDKLYLNRHIEDVIVSRERHRNILINTMKHLQSSLEPKNIDVFAEDIRLSLSEISKISGKKNIEDVNSKISCFNLCVVCPWHKNG